jgi:hypothetical protein
VQLQTRGHRCTIGPTAPEAMHTAGEAVVAKGHATGRRCRDGPTGIHSGGVRGQAPRGGAGMEDLGRDHVEASRWNHPGVVKR